MPVPTPPIAARPVRTSAGQRAYEWIRDAILRGDFAEGEFIDEVALSERVNTSRTPVREALQRLQVERYIDLLPRRGAQVRVVTATEMREIYQARILLESDALRGICLRHAGAPDAAVALIADRGNDLEEVMLPLGLMGVFGAFLSWSFRPTKPPVTLSIPIMKGVMARYQPGEPQS